MKITTLSYGLDGLGNLLRAQYTTPDGSGKDVKGDMSDRTVLYDGDGHMTVNGALEMSRFEGGYFNADGKAFYYLTDYQGNVVKVISKDGFGGQSMDYYPYGEPWVEWDWTLADTYPSFIKNRFLYGGKERITQFGLGLYHFEARMYRAQLGRFSTSDKKDIDTPWLSPFAYCACNPVNAIDPTGNVMIFINGKIGVGSPDAGRPYWNKSFVNGAKQYFSDNKACYTNQDYRWLSTARERISLGYEYAKGQYKQWKSQMSKDESFKLVSHSMGGAFSKGIEQFLKDAGENVDYNVMINAYEVGYIENNKDNKTFDIDYRNVNDPVVRIFDDMSGTQSLENADLIIREKSDEKNFLNVHRGPIVEGEDFWKNLRNYHEPQIRTNHK